MVRTTTYGPGIDQSQHTKSVSHIIMHLISFVEGFCVKRFCIKGENLIFDFGLENAWKY